MIFRLLVSSCAVIALMACSSTRPPASPVVAEIEGEVVTLDQLDSWIKDDWFERESRRGNASLLYQMREPALHRMIRERVLEAEAKQRGTTPELLLTQLGEEAGPVTDEEVEAFYEENRARFGSASLDQLSARIRRYLEQDQQRTALVAMVDDANVQVLLKAPRITVAADGPSLGPENAPVTIIEFGDFECPVCRRASPVVKEVATKYPEDVRIVYRHLPLEEIHPRARAAAEASACADEQGKFWEYHDTVYEQGKLGDADLLAYAKELGLDPAGFEACVSERRYEQKVSTDAADAVAAGITGTPSFVVNGRVLTGAHPISRFDEIIQSELVEEAP